MNYCRWESLDEEVVKVVNKAWLRKRDDKLMMVHYNGSDPNCEHTEHGLQQAFPPSTGQRRLTLVSEGARPAREEQRGDRRQGLLLASRLSLDCHCRR